jgi:Fur family ferric uptake transcriptional regulator
MAINLYTQKIKAIFDNEHAPVCANEILLRLQSFALTPNKTTIYRTLNSLVSKGYLRQILIDTNTCYYEKADGHHHHFFCTKCKSFEDLDPDVASEAKLLDKLKGKKILFHTLEFFGLCEQCQNK